MHVDRDPLATSLRRVALGLGAAVVAVGVLDLVGWAARLRPLTTFVIGSAPMNANTALALLACGASVALLAPRRSSRRARVVARALAIAVAALSVTTLVEHAFHVGLGIDTLLVHHPGALDAHVSTRISGGACVALLLLSAALLTVDLETRSGRHPSWALALCAILVPLQAAVAWLYGVQALGGQSPFTQLSPQTGVAFTALCAGTLLARPEHGFVQVVASEGPAGFTARRLLVAIFLLPVALGWVFVVGGHRAAQYQAMVGVSLVVVSAIVTGVAVVWLTAREVQLTDERRTLFQEALAAEREWFRTTLASIGDGVIAADRRGRVTNVNAVAEALTGIQATDAIGKPIDEVFRAHVGEGADVPEDPCARVLREGAVADLPRDMVLAPAGGTPVPVEGRAAPIRDAGARPIGVVLVFRDIGERRRVEQERGALLEREREARAEAEQASRAKDEFIATLSHELRTPLNSVLGWARLLRSGKLDAQGTSRAVQAIERGATTQAQIVDDLLDMARIVRGQLRLDVRPVDLAPVVDAAIETVRPAAAARGIVITSHLPERLPPVSGDPGRLQQVAWNLLANAIKFTPSGGRVDVGASSHDGAVDLVIHDTGVGIPSAFLPHVFERFRQADSSMTRAHGGLGLGLAIVRHLVEAHGGTVSAESDGPGMGATFRVRLPVHSVQPRPGRVEPGAPQRRPSRPGVPVSLAGVRALVVDDDPDTVEVVRELLEIEGAEVSAAASADEALAILAAKGADVLISDIGMPGKDGYELIRSIRALPDPVAAVPAAALTAFAHADHRQEALSAGYQLYLAKPIDPAELTLAVARLAGRA